MRPFVENWSRSITDLDLSAAVAAAVAAAFTLEKGLVLSCGSTGSGKTTAVEVLLGKFVSPSKLLRLGSEAGSRPANRVVSVGDIRSHELAERACDLARDNLVVGVMSSGQSRTALERLRSMDAAIESLAPVPIWVFTQRLCGRLCRRCRLPCPLPETVPGAAAEVAERVRALSRGMVYGAVGCDACRGGYDGKVPIFEALVYTPSAARGADDDPSCLGSIHEDGAIKLVAGSTSLHELERVL